MNLTIRRLIAAFFISLFLIFTPLLLLYTTGYRYNFKKTELQKTGALLIETTPKSANLYLNDEATDEDTPIRLNNLLPDNYLITLKKEGYFDWKKRLNVNSQETTFAEDITLFRNDSPLEKVIDENFDWLSFSPDKTFAVYQLSNFEQDYLYTINLKNKKTRLLFNNNKKFANPTIDWSKQGDDFIFQTNGESYILSTKNNISQRQFKDTHEKLIWATNQANHLYFQSKNKIFSLNRLTMKSKLVYTLSSKKELIDFIVNGDELFIIEKISNNIVLTKNQLNEMENFVPKAIELKNGDYKFLNSFNQRLAFINKTNKTLYLISDNLENIDFFKQDVETIDYQPKNNLLLLQTDQELSFINLNQNQLEEKVISRFSQNLNSAYWHSSSNYIFSNHDGKLKIIELDDRDGNQTFTLSPENVTSFIADENSEEIFYTANNNLWQLELE